MFPHTSQMTYKQIAEWVIERLKMKESSLLPVADQPKMHAVWQLEEQLSQQYSPTNHPQYPRAPDYYSSNDYAPYSEYNQEYPNTTAAVSSSSPPSNEGKGKGKGKGKGSKGKGFEKSSPPSNDSKWDKGPSQGWTKVESTGRGRKDSKKHQTKIEPSRNPPVKGREVSPKIRRMKINSPESPCSIHGRTVIHVGWKGEHNTVTIGGIVNLAKNPMRSGKNRAEAKARVRKEVKRVEKGQKGNKARGVETYREPVSANLVSRTPPKLFPICWLFPVTPKLWSWVTHDPRDKIGFLWKSKFCAKGWNRWLPKH